MQTEDNRLEEQFINILTDLIDDHEWLDSVLKQNKSSVVPQQESSKTIIDHSLQDVANRLVERVKNVESAEIDLEETIYVSTDSLNDLSLQAYPYNKLDRKKSNDE